MLDDKEILNGCKNNDRKAQELLYTKYASLLLGVLSRYTHNKTQAEDILQEAFVRIFRHIDQFRGESSLYTWMKKVAVNSALRSLQLNVDFIGQQPLSDNLELAENAESNSELSADEVLRVLQKMPDGYRTIFNLHAIEGYKHKEIAVLLDISENTSRSQYARAKKFLQNIFYKNSDIADLIYIIII